MIKTSLVKNRLSSERTGNPGTTRYHSRHSCCRWGVILLPALLMLPVSHAHMRLVSPEPRSSSDPAVQANINNGYIFRSEPCGDTEKIPVGAPSASYEAGADAVIAVDISQTHAGQAIQLSISFDNETFVELEPASASLPDSELYVAGGYPAPSLGLTRLAVRFPDQADTATIRAYDNYAFFMCADIELNSSRGPQVFDNGFEGS